jgi:hypothetical protein
MTIQAIAVGGRDDQRLSPAMSVDGLQSRYGAARAHGSYILSSVKGTLILLGYYHHQLVLRCQRLI